MKAIRELYEAIESAQVPVSQLQLPFDQFEKINPEAAKRLIDDPLVMADGTKYTFISKPVECPDCLRQDGKHNSRCPQPMRQQTHFKMVGVNPGFMIKATI